MVLFCVFTIHWKGVRCSPSCHLSFTPHCNSRWSCTGLGSLVCSFLLLHIAHSWLYWVGGGVPCLDSHKRSQGHSHLSWADRDTLRKQRTSHPARKQNPAVDPEPPQSTLRRLCTQSRGGHRWPSHAGPAPRRGATVPFFLWSPGLSLSL